MSNIVKTKHNYKISEEDKKEILLDYFINSTNQRADEIASRHNISTQWLYTLVKKKENQEFIDKYINENRHNFRKKSEYIIDKALNRINQNIEEGTASTRDLITTVGILYDKTRLENNLSTSNNEVKISIKIV